MAKVFNESALWSDSLSDQLATDRRLHIMLGAPWLTALGAVVAGDWTGSLWRAAAPFDEGDLLLTVLDSNPRTILSLEVALKAETARTRAFHVDEIKSFTPLILTTDIERAIGTEFPTLGPVPRALALSILDAIDIARQSRRDVRLEPEATCESLSSGHRAVALSESDGICSACDREFGDILGRFGLSALEVHVEVTVNRRTDERGPIAVVLCAACHRIVHAAADDPSSGLELSPYAELRYAGRPECPACGRRRAMPIWWGMPTEEPPEDVVTGGCCLPENPEQWVCHACGHAWSDRPPREFMGTQSEVRDQSAMDA